MSATLIAPSAPRTSTKTAFSALALGALGVVFGDIGTSPLYAFKQCFLDTKLPAQHDYVLGICSLILWALILVVCIKYVTFVMRVDHDGEGGILALLALLTPENRRGVPPKAGLITLVILVGAALLFGDGIITPAVSVISAVEGLNVATKAAQNYVVPITVAILVCLFFIQSRGTGKLGTMFGPIMLVWFVAIGIAGIVPIVAHPEVLAAINPIYALHFLALGNWIGFIVLGAVVLCVTGVEALYADLSHFGRKPITVVWYGVVLPALVLNYFGQGAYVIGNPKGLESPFFALVPSWGLIPMVALATVATVIASQALISGAFTLAEQAVALNIAPRMNVIHTSAMEEGQVFVPAVNVALAIGTILLVIGFRSSDKLAAAYGLAVAGTMFVTSIAYFNVIHRVRQWPLPRTLGLVAIFMITDTAFLLACLPKIVAGGWVPLLIGAVIFVTSLTWIDGRRQIAKRLAEASMPVPEFLADIKDRIDKRIDGTAVFLTGDPSGVPFVLHHTWLRARALHERIVLMTAIRMNSPRVPEGERVAIEELAPNLFRVTAKIGFMELPDIRPIVRACVTEGLHLEDETTTWFVADPKVLEAGSDDEYAMQKWKRGYFAFLLRNSRPLTDDLCLPANQTVEIRIETKM